ncbi:MAG: hypothetical protein AAFZ18_16785 [Myxococcota bacterium]
MSRFRLAVAGASLFAVCACQWVEGAMPFEAHWVIQQWDDGERYAKLRRWNPNLPSVWIFCREGVGLVDVVSPMLGERLEKDSEVELRLGPGRWKKASPWKFRLSSGSVTASISADELAAEAIEIRIRGDGEGPHRIVRLPSDPSPLGSLSCLEAGRKPLERASDRPTPTE